MRIFEALSGEGGSPVTVREGREWLEGWMKNREAAGSSGEKTRQDGGYREAASEVVIEARDVWFRYEKKLPDVVRDLNLTVRKGELILPARWQRNRQEYHLKPSWTDPEALPGQAVPEGKRAWKVPGK